MSDITLAVTGHCITATSIQIAEHFGKPHYRVLRAIANLDCSPEFALANFGEGYYTRPETGDQQHRCFHLTRDGFVFLCMGFTGKEAAKWKEKYIAAFNAMEAKLKVRDAQGGGASSVPAMPPTKDKLSKELKSHINRQAHAVAMHQFDSAQRLLTDCALDNLACGATESSAMQAVEALASYADEMVLLNVRDAQELVWAVTDVLDAAGQAICAIRRIEARTQVKLVTRTKRKRFVDPDFHQCDRLVQEVLERMVGS